MVAHKWCALHSSSSETQHVRCCSQRGVHVFLHSQLLFRRKLSLNFPLCFLRQESYSYISGKKPSDAGLSSSVPCALCVILRATNFGRSLRVCMILCWLLVRPSNTLGVSQGRICTDNFTCCHTEIEAADPTFHLTQSQYTDTGPTSPVLTL